MSRKLKKFLFEEHEDDIYEGDECEKDECENDEYNFDKKLDKIDEKLEAIANDLHTENSVQENNPVAFIIEIIAYLTYFGGFLGGLFMVEEFSWLVAIIFWGVSFFSGTMLLGFAEIIKLLQDIKNK